MKNNTYFISDIHLGAPSRKESQARERRLVQFLNTIEPECKTLYIVGDLFDYWFEYKHVVPKGHTRLLGTIAQMVDRGMNLHVFTGNHDLWMQDYLSDELGATLHHGPLTLDLDGKKFYIAHGDGLGPGDLRYKFIKRIFTNPFCLWIYKRLHPNLGVGFAARMSRLSRNSQNEQDHDFLGDRERQLLHSKALLEDEWFDYFIYGHRHHLKDIVIKTSERGSTKNDCRYIVLGDWITLDSYAVWNTTTLTTSTHSSGQ
ncbi:MAG: UDP-2,3-diacylglucosamine diphosphatase [Schleiferiaceae bacterium]